MFKRAAAVGRGPQQVVVIKHQLFNLPFFGKLRKIKLKMAFLSLSCLLQDLNIRWRRGAGLLLTNVPALNSEVNF